MEDLLKALQILAKYHHGKYPTGCDHDVMYCYVNPEFVSPVDCATLESLGFIADHDNNVFYSYKYGSA